MVWNILSSFEISCPSCASSQILVHHQLTHSMVGGEKALVLCKHCSAIAKTLMCYQCCFGTHHASCCEEN